MSTLPTLPGITSTIIQTDRLHTHVLRCGPEGGTAVLFIHGNVSSATYWEETMLALPNGFQAIAPDLRGYGDSEAKPIDATLGLDDMVADIQALLIALGISQYHLIGHSMGGGVAMKLTIANPANILSLTLVDPVSPYGYSGSRGTEGTPIYDDGAPAGAGGVNPEFIRLLAEKERGLENPMSPRNVFRQFYVKPPFVPAREDVLVDSMLATRLGEDFYPGNAAPSPHWPTVGPGDKGVVNAFSRQYFDASNIVHITPKPPILWIRGSDDLIVSDNAMFDIAALGAMGFVPGYPGVEECPPQPMLAQTRAVLEQYAAHNGRYQETVIPETGHTPYLEKPAEFNAAFHAHLAGNG
jgi:pimeloyl-ACP methyl ester carboxylesterase